MSHEPHADTLFCRHLLQLDASLNGTGVHNLTIVAVGCQTHYSLLKERLDTIDTSVYWTPNVTLPFSAGWSTTGNSVHSVARGFLNLKSPGTYAYGPSIIYENQKFYNFFCSPGDAPAWDFIRMSTSVDGDQWTEPTVALRPLGPGTASRDSVCDPSVIKFKGSYFLYHTCINTKDSPDGYMNNRICVAVGDSLEGPWIHYGKPVVQNITCSPKNTSTYCVGQPAAVVFNGALYLYYTEVTPEDTLPPNAGHILLAVSTDGIQFSAQGDRLYGQRDVDVKFDRQSEQLVMVQGDVGDTVITWSLSRDGVVWLPYNRSRSLAVNDVSGIGGSNNNPGILSQADGSFGGNTFSVYGSSYQKGWGDWHLYRSDIGLEGEDCTQCAPLGCDAACSEVLKQPAQGRCEAGASPTACCVCTQAPVQPDCHQCSPQGCVKACQQAGHTLGVCAHPGSTDPGQCCECFP